jgi:RimJ/RimL family protein N-acetyltransferase
MPCKLRPVLTEDHPWLVELHNDPEVLRNLTDPRPITMEQHLQWWARVLKDDSSEERLILEIDEQPIGFTKFYRIDRSNKNCILGADIHKDHRGRGHAHTMWSLMLDRCFTHLDLHRVSLTTAAFNDIAQRVYRRLGFKEEGRLVRSLFRGGAYHDQVAMYLLKEDWHATT